MTMCQENLCINLHDSSLQHILVKPGLDFKHLMLMNLISVGHHKTSFTDLSILNLNFS